MKKLNLREAFYNDDTEHLNKIESFHEIIRLMNKINLVGDDEVAKELLDQVYSQVKNNMIPEAELFDKFSDKMNQKISSLQNTLKFIEQELNILKPKQEEEIADQPL